MAKHKIAKLLENDIENIVEDLGYYFIDVEYKKEGPYYYLEVLIDNKKGIGLDDCEKVSRKISEWLDIKDPIDAAYMLSVSSAGLGRHLKTDKDFRININNELEISTFAPLNGKKKLIGILIDYNEDSITLKVSDEQIKIDRDKISKATKRIKIGDKNE